MYRKCLLVLLAILAPTVALCNGLAADQPLSLWHSASGDDKRELISSIVRQLRNGAGVAVDAVVPTATIVQCVDGNHTPDTLNIHDQQVKVTAGLAVVLCVKIHMPQLQNARYQQHGS